MSNSSYKVALKNGTIAAIKSKGGVSAYSQFEGMLSFKDNESGEYLAILPVSEIICVSMPGAVSEEDAKEIKKMGRDSKPCQQEDTTGKRTYRALYHAQMKKADSLSCEVEGLYKQICELKTALAAKDREIRALKGNDNFPFGDGVLPIRFTVMS